MIGVNIGGTDRFHLKLKKRSIIGGYENMNHLTSDYSYKALYLVRGYSLRKTKMTWIMDEFQEFNAHVKSFFIRFRHFVIHKPMLEFKKQTRLLEAMN